jgi:hypothetical protein
MPPPLPRCSGRASSSLISPRRVSLPRKGCRVGLHIVLFEACSAFTRVAACALALSPNRDTLIEGFSHFVTSMTAPIASGGSESPGGACTHWKAPPCHGAHPTETLTPEVAATRNAAFPATVWSAAPSVEMSTRDGVISSCSVVCSSMPCRVLCTNSPHATSTFVAVRRAVQ